MQTRLRRRELCCVAAILVVLPANQDVEAAQSPWRPGDRIAISADGNPDADPDDIGATPMTLAILAKAGLQQELVHYDFNNWLEYKKIAANSNEMWRSALGAQSRWGFDRGAFFDASNRPEAAISNLTAQINESTRDNPLYIIVGGPMELIYRSAARAETDALAHVRLVSHSGYNEYFRPRLWHRNLDDVIGLNPSIAVLRIVDQNAGLRTTPSFSEWRWLRDHVDPNLRWVYERMAAGLPDVSDAGMVSWLIGESDDDGRTSIARLSGFLGERAIPVGGGVPDETPAAPSGVEPVVRLPKTDRVFQEVGGRLVIEAESVAPTGDWVIEGREPGYTGTGYLRYLPTNVHAIHSPARGVLVYKLRVTEPGKYRMALKHSHRGAPERDKWNDVWTLVGIDPHPYGSIRKTYHSISREQFENGTGFTFQTTHDNYGAIAERDGHFSQPAYHLDADDHYFFIAGRSGGYRLDKIHFFKEGVSGFKEDSSPATPIVITGVPKSVETDSFGKATPATAPAHVVDRKSTSGGE